MNSRQRKAQQEAADKATYCSEASPMREEDWAERQVIYRIEALRQIGASINVLGPGFSQQIEQMQRFVYNAMNTNGFWDGTQDNFGQKVALVHTELSEMLEANRKSIREDDKVPDFTGEEAEAADTIIRLLDMSGRYNWRLGEAIIAKMLFNLSRPLKHGKSY